MPTFGYKLMSEEHGPRELVQNAVRADPTLRYHPAIVAQFAATLGVLSQGRFTLGLGSGGQGAAQGGDPGRQAREVT